MVNLLFSCVFFNEKKIVMGLESSGFDRLFHMLFVTYATFHRRSQKYLLGWGRTGVECFGTKRERRLKRIRRSGLFRVAEQIGESGGWGRGTGVHLGNRKTSREAIIPTYINTNPNFWVLPDVKM